MGKVLKWAAGMLRVAVCKATNVGRMAIGRGKPLYLGKGARIIVEAGGVCCLGSGVYLSRNCVIHVAKGAKLTLGAGVFFNENSRVIVQCNVEIGEYTLFGPNTCVYDHDHKFDENGVSEELICAPVSIGRKCWISANSVITKGVSIQQGCVIGAGSVVSKDILDGGVYAGVPAKCIRKYHGAHNS